MNMDSLKYWNGYALRILSDRWGWKDRRTATLEAGKVKDRDERYEAWLIESIACGTEHALAGRDQLAFRCFFQAKTYDMALDMRLRETNDSQLAFTSSRMDPAITELQNYIESRLARCAGQQVQNPYPNTLPIETGKCGKGY